MVYVGVSGHCVKEGSDKLGRGGNAPVRGGPGDRYR